jgi:hypothetical protein
MEGNIVVKRAISSWEGIRRPTFARSRPLVVGAVVMISSFCRFQKVSGAALFGLRGGWSEPMRGKKTVFENCMTDGGNLYALNPARSERYNLPVTIPINATATELSGRLIASCENTLVSNYWA